MSHPRPLRRVVVVGASLAGITTADTLRSAGFDGDIVVIGAEAHLPYTRPPLSKGVLKGTDSAASVLLSSLGEEAQLRPGTRAAALDVHAHDVVLSDGERVPYDGLVIATGARARSLATPATSGEHVLRTLDDALSLHDLLKRRPNVLVVGAGFLGVEIASTCRWLGAEVTVVDESPPLERLLGPVLADIVITAGRDSGVRFDTCSGPVSLWAPDGLVRGVQFADGEIRTADVVVSAVGDVAEVEWLAGSGLELAGGVVTDESGFVAPGIVAAGDVAVVRGADGALRRAPHWANAVNQARTAALTLLAGASSEAPPQAVPYFWTEAFGLTVKVCGHPAPAGTPEVLAGSIGDRSALLSWSGSAATVNYRVPLPKLAGLATAVPV